MKIIPNIFHSYSFLPHVTKATKTCNCLHILASLFSGN